MSRRALTLATLVVGCGRLDFDPRNTYAITNVEPRWAMPTGGPVAITLSADAGSAVVTIDGVPCSSLATSGSTIQCTAPAHAPGEVAVVASWPDGSTPPARFVYIAPGPRQLGGPADDRTSGVAIDRDGNVIVTGGTTGDLDGPNHGDFDAVTIKYDAAGTVAWVRQLGGPLYDYARDVAVDAAGDVTIIGYTAGDLGGHGNQGSNDVFVARYTADGMLAWVTQTGSAGDDQAWDLGVDASGATVVAIQTTGALGGPSAGGTDYAIARYAADGSLAWLHQAGTAAEDFGHSLAVAADGTSYLVGYTTGALEGTNAGGLDMFVARYEADGTRTWLHQRGGAGDDSATDAQLDPEGDVWIAGNTTGVLDGNAAGGATDVFAMRYAATGTWMLTRVYGGTGDEVTFGIAPTATAVYLECNTTTGFAGQPYNGGADDACAIALDRDGAPLWTRVFGGPTSDEASSIAFDSGLTGFLYVSLITDGGLDGMPSRGGNDIAVAKLDATGALR